MLPSASTYASDIDGVILLIAVLTGFWFFLTAGVFFWLIFKFRAREGQKALYITGSEKKYTKPISWAHYAVLVCDVLVIVAAIRVWVDVKMTLPEADTTVRVIGQQWAWSFQHAGPDGQLDTPDDILTADELHVEVDKLHHYKLVSRDVLHNFSVPVFRLKQDAIPGREITGWFEPTMTGEFDIQCAEMCGIGHGIMAARIFIETAEEHQAWMAEQQQKKAALVAQAG
ncbi:MAG: cytochrome C oxidase subunit II [Myxococcales bacterium FL481]|nr:MAG: cytochrome C oxidase subunit II [Myxococcales bacterium FL481]